MMIRVISVRNQLRNVRLFSSRIISTERQSDESRMEKSGDRFASQSGGDGGRRYQNYQNEKSKGPPKETGMEAPPASVVWDNRIHDPRVLKMGYVLDSTKWEIYELHEHDSEKWSVSKLAEKYQLPEKRIQAIITLKRRLVDLRNQGEELPGLTAEYERLAEEYLKKLSNHYGFRIQNSHHRETPHDVKKDLTKIQAMKKTKTIQLHDGDDEDAVHEYYKTLHSEEENQSNTTLEEQKDFPPYYYPPQHEGTHYQPQDSTIHTNDSTQEIYEKKPKQKPNKKPKKTGIFAIKDVSNKDAPTRIVDSKNSVRIATPKDELRRTWTPRPCYIDTIDLAPPRKSNMLHAKDSNFGVYYPFSKNGPLGWDSLASNRTTYNKDNLAHTPLTSSTNSIQEKEEKSTDSSTSTDGNEIDK
mmetsp:Transcript_13716/g.20456  ORF Transcript_13716/g.20456 Transcript_13716/m.20456 type:complete len:413 (+) Transcript_13716:27-1265(+)